MVIALIVVSVLAVACFIRNLMLADEVKQKQDVITSLDELLKGERQRQWSHERSALFVRLERYRRVLADVVRERNQLRIAKRDLEKTLRERVDQLDTAATLLNGAPEKLSKCNCGEDCEPQVTEGKGRRRKR